jgi:hypothetical protein
VHPFATKTCLTALHAKGKIFINHYSLNFACPLLPFHIVPLKNRSETTSILQQNYNNFCAYHKFVLPLQENIKKVKMPVLKPFFSKNICPLVKCDL